MQRAVIIGIFVAAIILALFGRVPGPALAAPIPTLNCHEAKQDAAWVLRHRWGGLYAKAREKHIVCDQRLNKTRWRLLWGFWAGGPWVYYGKVWIWRWPHDPTRFAYWIIPHAMRHR